MEETERSNVYLTGFSGTGKSAIGKLLAAKIGYSFIDLDDQISDESGRSIPDIFAAGGEAEFRAMEEAALSRASCLKHVVVATGGGAVLSINNREIMANSGVTICLEARPETIARRLEKQACSDPEERPLLSDENRLQSIESLKRARQHIYALADWTVHTDVLVPHDVVREIIHALELYGIESAYDPARWQQWLGRRSLAVVPVRAESRVYDVLIDDMLLPLAGMVLPEAGVNYKRAFVVTDSNVGPLHLESLEWSLKDAGSAVQTKVVQAGEQSKSLAVAAELYDWLMSAGAERADPVIALGGGVIGDLAGFVAATYMRGVPLVQAPTSLLAMIDSSVGGKTAVNHPLAKNSIGSFYQPRLVVADLATLATLPRRELTSGWGEVIKTAMIAGDGGALFDFLESEAARLCRLDFDVVAEVVRRCVEIKAAVVAEDERESGRRIILNYGHTIAHGLEAAGNYERFLHGEAVAIGMIGVAEIAVQMGLLDRSVAERQQRLIEAFGLPTRASEVDPRIVAHAMARDKKSSSGKVRWVLPVAIGEVQVSSQVPEHVIQEVVGGLISNQR